MEWQQLDFGTGGANSGSGDDLRTAFSKVDNNLNLLHENSVMTVMNVGSGVGIAVLPQSDLTVLNLKTIKVLGDLTISTDVDSITIESTVTPIESLSQDTAPTLSATLQVNGHPIQNFNTNTNLFDDLSLNNLIIAEEGGDTVLKSELNLKISSNTGVVLLGADLVTSNNITCGVLTGNTHGTHTGNVTGNVVGNVTGNTNGIHTGNVVGNVSGTAGDISNHNIEHLGNVLPSVPVANDTLAYNATEQAYESKSISNVVKDSGVAFKLPRLTMVQRELLTPENGDLIFNTTEGKIQGYENGAWFNVN